MNYRKIIADAMTRVYRHGMTTISGGNISMVDNDNNIYISPSGIDKSGLKEEDIMKVYKDGTIEGIHRPSVELPFHKGVYEKRPDIKVLVHAHPKDIVALSVSRVIPDLKLSPIYAQYFNNIGIAKYALPGSQALGKEISKTFEAGNDIVILENHGVVIGAQSMDRALGLIEALEDISKISIFERLFKSKAQSDRKLLDTEASYKINKEIKLDYHKERLEIISIIKRLYDQHIINGLFGEISVRLDDNKFLITPNNMDRLKIQDKDLIVVENNEATGEPDTYYQLHQKIYKTNPEINALIFSTPPNSMVFSVHETSINTNIIPEGFILLRKIQTYEINQISELIHTLGRQLPVAHLQNNFYISCGKNLLQAYDRVEVLEFGAASILSSMMMNKVHVISDEEIEKINKEFSNWWQKMLLPLIWVQAQEE